MLVRVDIESENAFFVPILGVTPKDSLLIKKITGLGPPDPSLFIGDYARDGGSYQGRRVVKRNPVITMELNPNPALGETVSGMREMLYKAFMDPLVDADYVKVLLHEDDGRVRYFVGYTEKFETDLFDVENLAQISLICPDPYIRDNTETVLTHPTGWTTVPFSYSGSAETGFEVEIYVNSPTSSLTLKNNNKTMVITRDFTAGQIVTIRTVPGSRRLTVSEAGSVRWSASTTYVSGSEVLYSGIKYRALSLGGNFNKIPETNPTYWTPIALPDSAAATSIIANLSVYSPWIELHSQSNVMKLYGETVYDMPAVIRQLKFVQSYWGI